MKILYRICWQEIIIHHRDRRSVTGESETMWPTLTAVVYRIDFVAGNDINDGISRVCGSYDDTIEHGEYELKGHETYVRVKCTDKNGKTAWSNPIWLAK